MVASTYQDVLGFILVTLVVIFVLMAVGDSLHVGGLYYFAVMAGGLLSGLLLKPPAGFLLGVALGLAIIFMLYVKVAMSLTRPEGLFVLGHLFSLPGALLGMFLARWIVHRRSRVSSIAALIAALLGVLLGFALNQFFICNTLMYCGVTLSR